MTQKGVRAKLKCRGPPGRGNDWHRRVRNKALLKRIANFGKWTLEAEWEKSGMPMDARDIESMIKAAIPDAEVTIRDLAGDGDHYAATVISESFRGKSRVQQHQIVYQSLKGQMGGVLHALALQTGIPD